MWGSIPGPNDGRAGRTINIELGSRTGCAESALMFAAFDVWVMILGLVHRVSTYGSYLWFVIIICAHAG